MTRSNSKRYVERKRYKTKDDMYYCSIDVYGTTLYDVYTCILLSESKNNNGDSKTPCKRETKIIV